MEYRMMNYECRMMKRGGGREPRTPNMDGEIYRRARRDRRVQGNGISVVSVQLSVFSPITEHRDLMTWFVDEPLELLFPKPLRSPRSQRLESPNSASGIRNRPSTPRILDPYSWTLDFGLWIFRLFDFLTF